MGTIILASSINHDIDQIIDYLPAEPKRLKMLRVITAGKGTPDMSYLGKGKKILENKGFDFQDIDIEGMDEQSIRLALVGKHVIFVPGGNAFYLLKAIRQSRFDWVVRDFIELGGIYIGASSGAYVACPTIDMHQWLKPGWNTVGLKDLTAMNLVSFLVKCHVTLEMLPLLREKLKTSKYEIRLLTDGQFLVIRNKQVKFCGSGQELKL